jgi:hypothetical protein
MNAHNIVRSKYLLKVPYKHKVYDRKGGIKSKKNFAARQKHGLHPLLSKRPKA